MTCAPMPQTMPRSLARAARNAATTALKSAAARMSGSESTNARDGRARSTAASRNPRRSPCSCAMRADTSARPRDRTLRTETSRADYTPRIRAPWHRPHAASPRAHSDQHRVAVAVEPVPAATASRYAASTRSRPANADTSISSDDFGRWKFVRSPRDDAEVEPRVDEDAGGSRTRRESGRRHRGRLLERPRRRRADGDRRGGVRRARG